MTHRSLSTGNCFEPPQVKKISRIIVTIPIPVKHDKMKFLTSFRELTILKLFLFLWTDIFELKFFPVLTNGLLSSDSTFIYHRCTYFTFKK